jgi:drug/metabolite transporter (DMT)-like permease
MASLASSSDVSSRAPVKRAPSSGTGAGHTSPPSLQVWSALACIYVVWGSTYLAIRVMVEDIPPLLGAGLRFAIAGGVTLAALAVRGRSVRVSRRALAGAALIGLLLPAGGPGLVTVAERDVPSGLAALLVSSVPLWVVLLRSTVGGERVARSTLAGLAVGFAGLALLLLPGSRPAEATAFGVVLVLVAACSWAVGSFLSPRLELPSEPLVSTAWQMLFGGIALLAAALIAGEPGDVHPARISTESVLAFVYLLTMGSWVAFTAYAWLLQNAPVSQVATYAYVNPLVAVVLGWAILDEKLGAGTIAGAALVVASVAAIVTRESGRRKPAAEDADAEAGPAHGAPPGPAQPLAADRCVTQRTSIDSVS